MNDYQTIWNSVLNKLHESLTDKVYSEVFSDVKEVLKFEKDYIYVVVPNQLIKFRIESFYLNKINDIVSDLYSIKVGFKFILEKDVDRSLEKQQDQEFIPTSQKVGRNLSSLYRFESFVVGESNRYAYLTATKVADNCGSFCNPLYIFGDVGLGKTHLMNAIGNFVLDNNINLNVIYVSCQKFSEDYFLATSTKNPERIEQFYNKYNNADLLLIDDVQFLEGKTGTQEEFFKIFEHLVSLNKQIVLTSDRPANNLKNVMARLKSRFTMGICVDIKQPDESLLINVLKNKLSFLIENPEVVPEEVLKCLASYYSTNIRDLEGALRTYVNYCLCMNKDFNLTSLEESLDRLIPKSLDSLGTSKVIFDNIAAEISSYYKISVEDLISSSRKQQQVYARQMLMYIAKNNFNLTIKFIGDNLGGRDHSTILHGIDKIADDIKKNTMVKQDYDFLSKRIGKWLVIHISTYLIIKIILKINNKKEFLWILQSIANVFYSI